MTEYKQLICLKLLKALLFLDIIREIQCIHGTITYPLRINIPKNPLISSDITQVVAFLFSIKLKLLKPIFNYIFIRKLYVKAESSMVCSFLLFV